MISTIFLDATWRLPFRTGIPPSQSHSATHPFSSCWPRCLRPFPPCLWSTQRPQQINICNLRTFATSVPQCSVLRFRYFCLKRRLSLFSSKRQHTPCSKVCKEKRIVLQLIFNVFHEKSRLPRPKLWHTWQDSGQGRAKRGDDTQGKNVNPCGFFFIQTVPRSSAKENYQGIHSRPRGRAFIAQVVNGVYGSYRRSRTSEF